MGGNPKIPTKSRLLNRNIIALDGRTSIRLEPELWDALYEIANREGIHPNNLIQKIESLGPVGNRTSQIRVYIITYWRDLANTYEELDGKIPLANEA